MQLVMDLGDTTINSTSVKHGLRQISIDSEDTRVQVRVRQRNCAVRRLGL